MLARISAKNRLSLPKAVTQAVGPAAYFDVQVSEGRIVLTPVSTQRSDAVRAKLAETKLSEADVDAAVAWARSRCPDVSDASPVDAARGVRRR